ncbi:hypothetical protein ACFO0N_06145 [Halobium salinum]|uniref:Uncharacterized protein n=1 Tax=Halobium salinum TaxID=1364940 RepID=A0ABD5PAQ8_9EURY|nr:hypothetical protein [Halobium salinum]
MWQEYIIAAVTLVLTLSVLPTIRDHDARVPLQTSGLTTVGLLVKAVAFGSAGMTAPALGAGLGCVMWAVLAYLRSGVRERLRPLDGEAESGVVEFPAADD